MIQMITGGCILKQTVILAPEVDGDQQHPEQSRVFKRGAGETLYVNPWYAAAPGHKYPSAAGRLVRRAVCDEACGFLGGPRTFQDRRLYIKLSSLRRQTG